MYQILWVGTLFWSIGFLYVHLAWPRGPKEDVVASVRVFDESRDATSQGPGRSPFALIHEGLVKKALTLYGSRHCQIMEFGKAVECHIHTLMNGNFITESQPPTEVR